ncbi:MAG: DedA family protein [Chlamydiae bacterium]|nr:DedA family protein [Chlamydiota bacterium]
MMHQIAEFLLSNQEIALPVMMLLILSAAVGVPVSIDILLIITAILATNFDPKTIIFWFVCYNIACIAASSIAYWIGRLGVRRVKPFAPFVEKMQKYYDRFGIWTVFFVRFIPFGARNIVYYTSGMAKLSYVKFLVCDIFACFLWSGIFFTIFYNISESLESLMATQKSINLIIFCTFAVAVIGAFCYKFTKRRC